MNSSQVTFSLAFLLFICGFIGFAIAGFESKAKSSIIMGKNKIQKTQQQQQKTHNIQNYKTGSVSSAVLCLCGIASRSKSHKTSTSGHSASLIVSLILCFVFAWRLFKAFGVEGKEYIVLLLSVMLVSSALASFLLIKIK